MKTLDPGHLLPQIEKLKYGHRGGHGFSQPSQSSTPSKGQAVLSLKGLGSHFSCNSLCIPSK